MLGKYRKVCHLCGKIWFCMMCHNEKCGLEKACICIECNVRQFEQATGMVFKEDYLFIKLLDDCYPDRHADDDNPSRRTI